MVYTHSVQIIKHWFEQVGVRDHSTQRQKNILVFWYCPINSILSFSYLKILGWSQSFVIFLHYRELLPSIHIHNQSSLISYWRNVTALSGRPRGWECGYILVGALSLWSALPMRNGEGIEGVRSGRQFSYDDDLLFCAGNKHQVKNGPTHREVKNEEEDRKWLNPWTGFLTQIMVQFLNIDKTYYKIKVSTFMPWFSILKLFWVYN